MPDRRRHRGAHPEDARLFASEQLPRLREAARDLVWLLERGYAHTGALQLVGDRHGLRKRQRQAITRGTCTRTQRADRLGRQVAADRLRGQPLFLDGFNLLTTVETALSGGLILGCLDGAFRDLASVHGTYRLLDETRPGSTLVGESLAELGVSRCQWFLDRPVSNSARLAGLLREVARTRGWPWEVQVVASPDRVLSDQSGIIVTADSAVLDRGGPWFDLARHVIEGRVPGAWVVELGSDPPASG